MPLLFGVHYLNCIPSLRWLTRALSLPTVTIFGDIGCFYPRPSLYKKSGEAMGSTLIFTRVKKIPIDWPYSQIQDRVTGNEQFCKSSLKSFSNFTGKYLRQSLFSNRVAGLRPASLLKKKLWHRCFPVNFAKILRTPFLQYTSGGLLL